MTETTPQPDDTDETIQQIPVSEILENLVSGLKEELNKSKNYSPVLSQIIHDFKNFIIQQPSPPNEWKERLGENAHKYDYHQLVFPENLTNPLFNEIENLDKIEREFIGTTCMALESSLISNNHFVYSWGHYPAVYSPKPYIMLETPLHETEDMADRFLYIFSDGSYISYGFEDHDEPEEYVGTDVFEVLQNFYKEISTLRFHFAVEHIDYGFIGSRKD